MVVRDSSSTTLARLGVGDLSQNTDTGEGVGVYDKKADTADTGKMSGGKVRAQSKYQHKIIQMITLGKKKKK